jgi:16S rRNA processing protein RimM
MAQDLCLIGSIVGAHGLRGEVKVQSFSDLPGRFAMLDSVLLGSTPKRARSVPVSISSEHGPRVIMHVEDCHDRDAAEALIGLNIYVEEERMEAPPDGRHFIHDLIGCAVRTASGESRGTVRDVMLLPANDIYVVEYQGREVLIPAVPAIVTQVDTTNRTITVEPIYGLFEDLDES